MWVDVATVTGFLVSFLSALVFGMTVVRARRRLRHISDVAQIGLREKPNPFRKAMAGTVPLLSGEEDSLCQDLKRAGYYGPEALVEYLAARNFVALGTLFVGGASAVMADPSTKLPQTILIAAGLAAVVAYVLPRMILTYQASTRLHRIQKGLPDALDIIRMCLTGGLSLRDALERVARDIEFFHKDIAIELEVVRRHAEADTMQRALKEFARRMNTQDVNSLSSLVSQTEVTGTHVATAVTEFADTMRRQYRQRVEERANKTTIALLFPVILCLAPPVFILLVGPPIMQIRNFIHEAHQSGGALDPTSFTEQIAPISNLSDIPTD